jgi:hypothetical protein
MPQEFRDAKCVVTASAGTGRKGAAITRMRLYFLHPLATDNPTLKTYAKGVAAKKKLPIDPCVLQPGQPIYTARPLFEEGLKDPVPEADWAFVLDGSRERVELELGKYVPAGKKVEAYIARAENISGGDWRDLADRIVGHSADGLIGDIPGTFHEPLMKVIGCAVHVTANDDEIIEFLLQLIAKRGGTERQATYDEEWLRSNIKWCRERDAEKPGVLPPDPGTPPIDNKPTIQLDAGQLPRITAQVQLALLNTGLFQRSGRIVRPDLVKLGSHDGKIVKVPGIAEVTLDQLRLHAMRHIDFAKYSIQRRRYVATNYTLEEARALLTLTANELNFPFLRGVSKTPLVDRSGRLMDKPGYDPQSLLYYELGDTIFPPLPEKLGKDEAIKYLKLLKEPLRQYPFELHEGETADRSIALSVCVAYFITRVNRLMWGWSLALPSTAIAHG